jgi:hypothetical protein
MMMKNLVLILYRPAVLVLYLLLSLALYARPVPALSDTVTFTRAEKKTLRQCRSNPLAFYHSRQMKEFTRLMNLARIDPVLLEKYVTVSYGAYEASLLPNELLQKKHRNRKTSLVLLRPSFTLHLGSFYHAFAGGLAGSVGHQNFETRLMASLNFNTLLPKVQAGENCAYGDRDAIDSFTLLINSPGHRSNILHPGFMRMGASRKYHTGYRYNTVSMFSGPKLLDNILHPKESAKAKR